MLKLSKKTDLPVGSLSIRRVLKCIEDLFEGQVFTVSAFTHFPDMAVSTTADLLEQLIALQNVRLDLLRHTQVLADYNIGEGGFTCFAIRKQR